MGTRSTSQEPEPVSIRPIDPENGQEINLVAERMRDTLTEVLGAEGHAMYSLEWLRNRVRWHLKPEACTGQVLLAKNRGGAVMGHVLVRVEDPSSAARIGLIATIYVLPSFRRSGVARALLDAGENWLIDKHIATLATDTSQTNLPLIRLFEQRGYTVTFRSARKRMLRLSRNL